jgi:hypothetical protein
LSGQGQVSVRQGRLARAIKMIFGFGQLFSFEMIWGLERYLRKGDYLSSALLRMLGQVVLLGLLLFIYIEALSLGVLGGLVP